MVISLCNGFRFCRPTLENFTTLLCGSMIVWVLFTRTQAWAVALTGHSAPAARSHCIAIALKILAHEMGVSSAVATLPLAPPDANDLLNVLFIGPSTFEPDHLGESTSQRSGIFLQRLKFTTGYAKTFRWAWKQRTFTPMMAISQEPGGLSSMTTELMREICWGKKSLGYPSCSSPPCARAWFPTVPSFPCPYVIPMLCHSAQIQQPGCRPGGGSDFVSDRDRQLRGLPSEQKSTWTR